MNGYRDTGVTNLVSDGQTAQQTDEQTRGVSISPAFASAAGDNKNTTFKLPGPLEQELSNNTIIKTLEPLELKYSVYNLS